MATNPSRIGATSSPGRGDWKESLGRVGLVGKGVLYAVIGLLAVQLALGDASADQGSTGAIQWIAEQPFGRFLLVALTVALFSLAAWRLLDALLGDPVEGSEAKDRAKFAGLGIVYLGLAFGALGTTIANWSSGSSSSGGGSDTRQQATAAVMELPAGRWLVVAAGLAVIVFAGISAKRHAIDTEFMQRLDTDADWVEPLGRAGYAAKAVTLAIIGWFLVQAGLTYQPDEANGLSAVLQELSGQGWGQLLLWLVAVGLLGYGLFALAEARYRRAA
jgi:hypothetical protein